MSDLVPVRRALISVSDKTGLADFATRLHQEFGVELISTGGTAKFLRDLGLPVTDVAQVTGFPEMMDGRVKTLHPKIHGGLLAKRGDVAHERALKDHAIPPIDLLVVNLYPFEATVARGCDFDACIENIDIGGPALIRAGAKNHASVTVVVEPEGGHLEETTEGEVVTEDTDAEVIAEAGEDTGVVTDTASDTAET